MILKYSNHKYGKILLKVLVGSHAHGTATENSDKDYVIIYLQSINSVLEHGYKEQVNITKDEVAYELKRFVELCFNGNPTMLEILFSPEDCIIYQDKLFNLLLTHRNKFLTKQCKFAFGGYAKGQVKKASGLQKKLNWKKEEMVRLNPIDFCKVVLNKHNSVLVSEINSSRKIKQGTFPLKKYLERKSLTENDVVLTKLNGSSEGHQLYLQKNTHGICINKSNTIRTSETPKDALPIATVLFNGNAYSNHCRRYKEYETWLREHNTQRYVDIKEHGQTIDGKNLLHTIRTLEMGFDLANLGHLQVRRPNRQQLLDIRHGKVDLKAIIKQAEDLLQWMDQKFDSSDLPGKVDKEFFYNLIIKIRKIDRMNWFQRLTYKYF